MRTHIFLTILTVIAISAGLAFGTSLERDENANIIQGPAFNGTLTRNLTNTAATNRVNVDLSQNTAYSVYCAAVSKERTMFGNYTKSQRVPIIPSSIPATTWHTNYVNKRSPFLNISGCAGQLRIH